MVAKLRSVADELRALGDPVRAEELDGRVKAARQEAGRALRDRLDLFADGGETIRLGRHRFAVNTQAIDLTLVPHDGTDGVRRHRHRLPRAGRDPAFAATRPFWDQLLVSESPRSTAPSTWPPRSWPPPTSTRCTRPPPAARCADLVRRAAEERYDEGYERGVHDPDAAAILDALLRLHAGAGLLRYPPAARAAAQLFWAFGAATSAKPLWTRRRGLARPRPRGVRRLAGARRAPRRAVRPPSAPAPPRTACRTTRWPGSTSSRSWPPAHGFVHERRRPVAARRLPQGARSARAPASSTTTCARSAPTSPPATSWSRPGWPRLRRGQTRLTWPRRWRSSCRDLPALRLVGGADRHRRGPARHAPADHRAAAAAAPGRVPRPDRRGSATAGCPPTAPTSGSARAGRGRTPAAGCGSTSSSRR